MKSILMTQFKDVDFDDAMYSICTNLKTMTRSWLSERKRMPMNTIVTIFIWLGLILAVFIDYDQLFVALKTL